MPTYLSPGIYLEEVTSGSKPIEGVGTSVAAFVGLAPGGPVNTPVPVSQWWQFRKVYGDPTTPGNGPFMEGAFLAHAVRSLTPAASAAAVTDQPCSETHSARSLRLFGQVRALPWSFIRCPPWD